MDRISLVMNFIAIVMQCFVINEFGMNSFGMFSNFMNLYIFYDLFYESV